MTLVNGTERFGLGIRQKVTEEEIGATGNGVLVACFVSQACFGVNSRLLCGDFNVWKHQSKDCHFLVVQQEVTRSAFQGQRRVGGGKIGNVGGPADLQFFHQQDIVGQFI